jgi:hypothetical protein
LDVNGCQARRWNIRRVVSFRGILQDRRNALAVCSSMGCAPSTKTKLEAVGARS